MNMEIKEYFFNFWYRRVNYYRVIHSIKTAFACLIGVAIEKYYDLPAGQWIPITVMVVMSAQKHFGGALRKAYMRFLGTISGIAITIIILEIFGNDLAVIFGTVFVAIIIFTYVASSHKDINYAGTLGGVTILLTLTGQQVGVEAAVQRGLYIVVGILIALFVSRIFFPIHARDRFRYHVARTLKNLQSIYFENLQISKEYCQKEIDNTDLENVILADIPSQLRLIDEAVVGSLSFAEKRYLFIKIVDSEYQLNRLINLMYRSLCEIESLEIIKKHLDAVKDLHVVVRDSLDQLADCFENIKQPQLAVSLSKAEHEIAQLIEKNIKNDTSYEMFAEHLFVFFMGQIFKELEKMRQLIEKVNSKNNNNVV
jgi:uncharacterized membrane protein YccC